MASAVGLVSIEIFGCKNPASKTYAELLGYALQMTNILRDVAEDSAVGRIYLPIEDLRKFDVSESSLLAGKPSGNFTALMRFEAGRARALLPPLATLFRTTTQTLSNPPNLCARSMSASSRGWRRTTFASSRSAIGCLE